MHQIVTGRKYSASTAVNFDSVTEMLLLAVHRHL